MNNFIVIKSELLEVQINLLGAEVRKVTNIQTKCEYMWSGRKDIWAGVSPVLFPVVGKTINGEIRYQGVSYPQGNHGFARSSYFQILKHCANSVTLGLDKEFIREHYPFKLDLEITYTLDECRLITDYQVYNHEDSEAFFSLGAHPAFACPFDDKHVFEDYIIEFENYEQDLIQHEITPMAFLTGVVKQTECKKINLTATTFVDDALIFNNYTSKFVTLKELDSSRYIKVSLNGFNWLGIWSKPGADYVCIEPWCGHSDYINFNEDINFKRSIETILAKKMWNRSYIIEFGY